VKIYVMTDMEGVSGIDRIEQLDRDGGEFRASCEKLMSDVNAAVAGAFDGGATQATVRDGHGGGGNFLAEMLDERAHHDTTDWKDWPKLLAGGFDGAFAVGHHAMAGTIDAFLDHTQDSTRWHDYYLNGRRCGEIAQVATWMGAAGIPLLLVTGDEAACVEAREFVQPVETAAVKRGDGRNRAVACPPDEARDRIRAAARRAMALIGKAKPFTPPRPLEIVVEFNRTDYCEGALARGETLERIDARTVRKVTADPYDILP